jgi:hypothetical protein
MRAYNELTNNEMRDRNKEILVILFYIIAVLSSLSHFSQLNSLKSRAMRDDNVVH